MEREMLNINGNLVGEIKTTAIDTKEGEKEVANFTIVRKNKEEGSSKCIKNISYSNWCRAWSMGCYQPDGRLWE